jgi:hypothetical protein
VFSQLDPDTEFISEFDEFVIISFWFVLVVWVGSLFCTGT